MTKKAKALVVPMPRSAEECDEYIYNVGELQRVLERIETNMNETIARAKAEAEAAAEPIRERLVSRLAGIEAWCLAHRDELTGDGESKSYRFGSGEVAWREAPPKVVLSKKTKLETVVDWLRDAPMKFRKFIRPKYELNKEALLADPQLAAEVPGVAIRSAGEGFFVKPFGSELEEAG